MLRRVGPGALGSGIGLIAALVIDLTLIWIWGPFDTHWTILLGLVLGYSLGVLGHQAGWRYQRRTEDSTS